MQQNPTKPIIIIVKAKLESICNYVSKVPMITKLNTETVLNAIL